MLVLDKRVVWENIREQLLSYEEKITHLSKPPYRMYHVAWAVAKILRRAKVRRLVPIQLALLKHLDPYIEREQDGYMNFFLVEMKKKISQVHDIKEIPYSWFEELMNNYDPRLVTKDINWRPIQEGWRR